MTVYCAFATCILPVTSNYCEPKLCKFMVRNDAGYLVYAYKSHVACGNILGNPSEFGPSCYAHYNYNMTNEFIDLILSKHNSLRADTANGRIPGYLPANQMSELVINDYVKQTLVREHFLIFNVCEWMKAMLLFDQRGIIM